MFDHVSPVPRTLPAEIHVKGQATIVGLRLFRSMSRVSRFSASNRSHATSLWIMDLNEIDRVTYSDLCLFLTFDQNYIYMIYYMTYSRNFGAATNKGAQNFGLLNFQTKQQLSTTSTTILWNEIHEISYSNQKKPESRSGPKLWLQCYGLLPGWARGGCSEGVVMVGVGDGL